jgi:hypothetical protein
MALPDGKGTLECREKVYAEEGRPKMPLRQTYGCHYEREMSCHIILIERKPPYPKVFPHSYMPLSQRTPPLPHSG